MSRRALATLRRCSIAAVASGLLLAAGCTVASSSAAPTAGTGTAASAVTSTAAGTGTATSTRTAAPASTATPTRTATPIRTTAPTRPTEPRGTATRTGRTAATTGSAPVSATSRRTSAPVTTPVTATVTRTKPGATITVTVAPPRGTAEPAPTAGECPYLSADVVSDITGQHHGQTQLIQLDPHPMCVFYRSDGGRMGSVRVIRAASAAAAAAAVDQHVPIAGSQPASQPAGWTGGSMTSPGQMTQDSSALSVYAVSKGTIAIVAEEDESPSLKARLMAVCAIYGLGLEPAPAPDYCRGAEQ